MSAVGKTKCSQLIRRHGHYGALSTSHRERLGTSPLIVNSAFSGFTVISVLHFRPCLRPHECQSNMLHIFVNTRVGSQKRQIITQVYGGNSARSSSMSSEEASTGCLTSQNVNNLTP